MNPGEHGLWQSCSASAPVGDAAGTSAKSSWVMPALAERVTGFGTGRVDADGIRMADERQPAETRGLTVVDETSGAIWST